MTINGIKGVYFAVWAPNAMRVSVVGDFNHWDGRAHQMNRLSVSGIFELFIPGVKPGALYKYEVKYQRFSGLFKSGSLCKRSRIKTEKCIHSGRFKEL